MALILTASSLPKALEDHEATSSEHAISLFTDKLRENLQKAMTLRGIFHVTQNPAARWLQMDDMMRNTFIWEKMNPKLFIRDNEICVPCACKYFSESGNHHTHSLVLL